jgi:NADH-quinone oxidoreductase subunit L
VLYFLALATAVMTAIYMTRMMVMTFLGAFRGDHHTIEHAHESPWTMLLPMIILAVGSLFAGFLWAGMIPGADLFERTLSSVVGAAQSMKHGSEHHGPSVMVFALAGTAAAVIGALLGYLAYGRKAPSTEGAPGPHGFGKRWTLAFDTLHLIAILPTKAAAWISDVIIQPLFERTQIVLGYMAAGTGDALRKLQQPSIRIQLGMAIVGAVILTASILKEVF